MRRHKHRSTTGISMVEFAAAMAFGLPLIITMVYACLEANLLFTIRTNLDVATRRAAQVLITQYETTGTVSANTTNGNLPSALAFNVLTGDGKHYYISSTANQFTWTWDLTDSPATITVTTTYPTSGSSTNGLLPFPTPDPLGISTKFTILTSATFPVPPPS